MRRTLLDLFRLSRREYYADFFITPPVTVLSLALSIAYAGAWWRWPLAVAGGFAAWTLYEYLLHRFVLHRLWPFTLVHALHHDRQKDFIGTHPVLTVAIYAALWIMFGTGTGNAAMAGFSAGYVVYSAMHTLFHYARPARGTPLYNAKRRHMAHHVLGNKNFGVTTCLWDRVFGTELLIPLKP